MLVHEVGSIAAIGPSGFYEARRGVLCEDSFVDVATSLVVSVVFVCVLAADFCLATYYLASWRRFHYRLSFSHCVCRRPGLGAQHAKLYPRDIPRGRRIQRGGLPRILLYGARTAFGTVLDTVLLRC